jgi:hypothetical protein
MYYVRRAFINYWIDKIARNEILHIQSTTQNAVLLFRKLNGRYKSEYSR